MGFLTALLPIIQLVFVLGEPYQGPFWRFFRPLNFVRVHLGSLYHTKSLGGTSATPSVAWNRTFFGRGSAKILTSALDPAPRPRPSGDQPPKITPSLSLLRPKQILRAGRAFPPGNYGCPCQVLGGAETCFSGEVFVDAERERRRTGSWFLPEKLPCRMDNEAAGPWSLRVDASVQSGFAVGGNRNTVSCNHPTRGGTAEGKPKGDAVSLLPDFLGDAGD